MPLRTAITAAAARTALGDDVTAVWAAICDGAVALAPIAGFDASGFGAPHAAQIWTEPETAEDDPALRILGPHGRLLAAVARRAHDEAGLADVAREEVGLFLGMGMVDAPIGDLAPAVLAARAGDEPMSLEAFFAGAYRAVHPLWPLAMLNNVAAGQIAIDLDLRGDNLVLASDADAGLRAVLEAARSVSGGACRAALAAGVAGRVSPALLARLALQERLPGVDPGEGAAALVLEDPESARARGRRVRAVVRGGATAFGRSTAGAWPHRDTWGRALQGALSEAASTPAAIDAVFLHAEGGAAADREEREALEAAGLGAAARIATKSRVGHLGPGAPALDVLFALEALRSQRVPPTSDGRPQACAIERVVVLAGGPYGGAGALVLEAAA